MSRLGEVTVAGLAVALCGCSGPDAADTTDDGTGDGADDAPVEVREETDDDGVESASDEGVDEGGDDGRDEGGLPTTLTVRVWDTAWWNPGERWPLARATVAFDAPDGRRIERETGPDGTVLFEELDWTMGPAAVTAYATGHLLISRVGLTGAESTLDIELPLPSTNTYRFASLWGYAANMESPDNMMLVTATVPNDRSYYTGSGWEMHVVPDLSHTVVATEFNLSTDPVDGSGFLEFFHWLTVERRAARPSGSESVALDFDAAVPSTHVRLRVELPERAESPLREDSTLWGWVTSVDSAETLLLGYYNRIVPVEGDDGAHSCDLEFVTSPDALQPLVYLELPVFRHEAGLPDAGKAVLRVAGYPVSGTVPLRPIDLPEQIVPADPLAPHPIDEPIAWNAFDADVGVFVEVERVDTDFVAQETLWRIWAPNDATTVRIPELPLALDPGAFFETGPFVATVVLYRRDAFGEFLAQETRGPSFLVRP